MARVSHGLQEEGLWFWDFEGNKMFYDVEEQVRFRVKSVKFQKPPSVQELRSRGGEDDLSGTAAKPFAVMQVALVSTTLLGSTVRTRASTQQCHRR